MQKSLIVFLFFTLVFSCFAEPIRPADSRCTSKNAPKIDYNEAIQIALKAADVKDDANEVSIVGAFFLCEGRKGFWAIGLDKLQNDKSQLLVKVFMDRSTEVSTVKNNQH